MSGDDEYEGPYGDYDVERDPDDEEDEAERLFEEYEERVFFFNNGFGDQRYEAPATPRTFGVTANYTW